MPGLHFFRFESALERISKFKMACYNLIEPKNTQHKYCHNERQLDQIKNSYPPFGRCMFRVHLLTIGIFSDQPLQQYTTVSP